MNSQLQCESESCKERLSDADYLTDLLHKLKIDKNMNASDIIVPVVKRGRPSTGKCGGVKGTPCADNLHYNEKTKHLFSSNSKTRCKKCVATNYRRYYRENREKCSKQSLESTRKQRAIKKLIELGAQSTQVS